MELAELRVACQQGEGVLLWLPAPNGEGYTRRLCGRYGPRGQIINGTEKGQTVQFSSAHVLRFLDKLESEMADETAGGE